MCHLYDSASRKIFENAFNVARRDVPVLVHYRGISMTNDYQLPVPVPGTRSWISHRPTPKKMLHVYPV